VDIRAWIKSLPTTDPWAKAGVMMRETTAPGARHGTTYAAPVGWFEMLARTAQGKATLANGGIITNASPNNWVRIVRIGDIVMGYSSANGTDWDRVSTYTFPSLPNTMLYGLAVSSLHTNALATALFDNVQIINGVLPAVQATVTIVATDAEANEAGRGTGTYRIYRTGSTSSSLIVCYSLVSGTGCASKGDISETLDGTTVIPAGQSYVDITVTPVMEG
jgi:hypothetical protein